VVAPNFVFTFDGEKVANPAYFVDREFDRFVDEQESFLFPDE